MESQSILLLLIIAWSFFTPRQTCLVHIHAPGAYSSGRSHVPRKTVYVDAVIKEQWELWKRGGRKPICCIVNGPVAYEVDVITSGLD